MSQTLHIVYTKVDSFTHSRDIVNLLNDAASRSDFNVFLQNTFDTTEPFPKLRISVMDVRVVEEQTIVADLKMDCDIRIFLQCFSSILKTTSVINTWIGVITTDNKFKNDCEYFTSVRRKQLMNESLTWPRLDTVERGASFDKQMEAVMLDLTNKQLNLKNKQLMNKLAESIDSSRGNSPQQVTF